MFCHTQLPGCYTNTYDYASSPSVTTFSSSCDFSMSSSGEFYCISPNTKRSELVMMHDPYSTACYTYMPKAFMAPSMVDSASDCENGCDCCEEDELALDIVDTEDAQKKKIRKKKVKCPNGHRAAKRLRYRKGQSHYSCLECLIRWKA